MVYLGAVAAATLVYVCYTVYRLISSDADLRLRSKRAPPDGAFQDKVVWITGASQGLGEELALYFSSKGANLILSSRNKAALEAVKAKCSNHSDVHVLPLDLCADEEVLKLAVDQADALFGCGVDYLVHNAGASQHALAEDTSGSVLHSMLALNTVGPILLTQLMLKNMLNRGRGRFVVVASMASIVPSPGQAVYSCCKSALMGYFTSLNTEVNDRGVGVTICCPGPIATGQEGKPRCIYGDNGLVTKAAPTEKESRKRLSPSRVAELIATATYYQLDICWIARKPVLQIAYLMQYLPTLGYWLMKLIGPARAESIKTGESGYNVKTILQRSLTRTLSRSRSTTTTPTTHSAPHVNMQHITSDPAAGHPGSSRPGPAAAPPSSSNPTDHTQAAPAASAPVRKRVAFNLPD